MRENLTDQQERFVQELIKGKSQREAYKIAYPKSAKWKENAIDSQASQLFKNSKVAKRYNELHNRVIKESEFEAIATAKDVLKELTAIGLADILDFVEYRDVEYTDPNGDIQTFPAVTIKKTAEIPKYKRKAISSIKQTKDGVEIKLNDKMKALQLLGEHLGIFNAQSDDGEGQLKELIEAIRNVD